MEGCTNIPSHHELKPLFPVFFFFGTRGWDFHHVSEITELHGILNYRIKCKAWFTGEIGLPEFSWGSGLSVSLPKQEILRFYEINSVFPGVNADCRRRRGAEGYQSLRCPHVPMSPAGLWGWSCRRCCSLAVLTGAAHPSPQGSGDEFLPPSVLSLLCLCP